MAELELTSEVGFRRCAVCKIDLKGRFVYIDDAVADLLGYSKEDLFGRSAMESLDTESQATIERLLERRNHYETFYDTTELGLVTADGSTVPTRAIVSLNFIAGNPVNFQLILDTLPDQDLERTAVVPEPMTASELAAGLTVCAERPDARSFLTLLSQFTGVERLYLYMLTEDGLEPRSSAEGLQQAEGFPPTEKLHVAVAESGGSYSYTDQDTVRSAIEAAGVAPREYIKAIPTDGNRTYLLRAMFEEEDDPAAAAEAVRRSEMLISLWPLITQPAAARAGGGEEVQLKFAVGLLDHLGIGAGITDSDGNILGYNRSLLGLLQLEALGDTVEEFATILAGAIPGSPADRIRRFYNPQAEESEGDLRIDVSLPQGDRAILSCLGLSDQGADLSSVMVLQPQGGSEQEIPIDACAFWYSVIGAIRESSLELARQAQDVSHALYCELAGAKTDQPDGLSRAARHLGAVIDSVGSLARTMSHPDEPGPVDLGLLTSELFDEVLELQPELEATCYFDGLPRITASREKLRQILRALFTRSLRLGRPGPVELKVEAEVGSQSCLLAIHDPQESDPPTVELDLIDPTAAPETDGFLLPLAAQLLRSQGGSLSVEAVDGHGVTYRLRIANTAQG